MKLSTMRNIDETVGIALTSLLGLGVQLKRRFWAPPAVPEPEQVKTIVLQKYFGMGSILHALPLIKALRLRYPQARIIFLTLKSNRTVIELCNCADETICLDTSSAPRFVKSVLDCVCVLLRTRIDLCLDLEFFSKFSLLISLFTGAPVRVGLHQRKIRPDGILTHVVYYNNYKHISEIYFAYVEALGIPYHRGYFSSLLPAMPRSVVRELRQSLGIPQQPELVVVNVNAGDLFFSRRWPAGHFATLIQSLVDRHPQYHYVLVGGGSDHGYVESICAQVAGKGRLTNAAGKTSIAQLFALIESAYLVISCDSGPLHIASLYERNLAAFFGPETPVVYGPVNENALVFYSGQLYCSPCLSVYDSKKSLYGESCKDNACISCFQPEPVLRALEERFLTHPALTLPRRIAATKASQERPVALHLLRASERTVRAAEVAP